MTECEECKKQRARIAAMMKESIAWLRMPIKFGPPPPSIKVIQGQKVLNPPAGSSAVQANMKGQGNGKV